MDLGKGGELGHRTKLGHAPYYSYFLVPNLGLRKTVSEMFPNFGIGFGKDLFSHFRIRKIIPIIVVCLIQFLGYRWEGLSNAAGRRQPAESVGRLVEDPREVRGAQLFDPQCFELDGELRAQEIERRR